MEYEQIAEAAKKKSSSKKSIREIETQSTEKKRQQLSKEIGTQGRNNESIDEFFFVERKHYLKGDGEREGGRVVN